MSRILALVLLRAALLPALAASAALTVEYRMRDASFCGPESACSALSRTDVAHLWGLGVTLPEAGLLAWAIVFALSLSRGAAWAARLAVLGGAGGAALLAVQAFVVGQFCWLCVVVDVAGVVAGVAGVAWLRASERLEAPRRSLAPWAWGALGVLAVAAPLIWPFVKPTAPLPPAIREYYRSGKINVIEFADFQCPYCRVLHGTLKELLAPYGERVHFVRLNMPLPRHEQARDAALAAICAEPSGKADALVEFLFTTQDLSVPSIMREAARLGIPRPAFQACLASPAAAQRLDRESQILRELGFQGLPTTYVGTRRILGAQSAETFQDALERAAQGGDEPGVPGWAYLLIVGAAAASVVRFGVRPAERATAERATAE